ncbi:MAG: class I SAM-dependent methyltransferase [Cyanobacteria bacterium J06633_8]
MMNAHPGKDYPLLLNLSETDLDDNSSLKKMLCLIGENKRVIDFGCATGYFAKFLNSRGCQVTGVEVNTKAAKVAEEYCEQVINVDLDFVSLNDILSASIAEEKFDVAVFGDILEHLRNPWKVLQETRNIIKPQGYVVASIPNIAHGAIRLALLQGNFDYQQFGILDNTHLRFFTRKTVTQLFEDSGYLIDSIEQTKLPIYCNSKLVPVFEKDNFDSNITNQIEQDEDADTLQFVIRGYPICLENKYTILQQQYCQVVEKLGKYENQLEDLQIELQKSKIELQTKNSQLEDNLIQLQQTQVEFEKAQNQLQQNQIQIEEVQSQLKQTQLQLQQEQIQLQHVQHEWEDNQIKLQQAHAGWEHCQQIIKTMETSKFWKLRRFWLKFRNYVGLKAE